MPWQFPCRGVRDAHTDDRIVRPACLKQVPATLVFYESGPRLSESLADLAAVRCAVEGAARLAAHAVVDRALAGDDLDRARHGPRREHADIAAGGLDVDGALVQDADAPVSAGAALRLVAAGAAADMVLSGSVSAGAASSLIAGVIAVGEMPYRNGDWIKVDGIYGEVRHVGMRTVQVVTPSDDVVSIPHSRLWDTPIFNTNDGAPRLQCIADFYLHPLDDAAQVQQVLADVALTSAFIHFGDAIAVVVHEKPWGTWYRLKAYPVDARHQFRFVTDLTVRGKAALIQLGVRFAIAPTVESDSV